MNKYFAKISTDEKVKVKELAVDFEVTEDCIRKDLTALEKEGLLKRIHGGAMQVRRIFMLIMQMNVRVCA